MITTELETLSTLFRDNVYRIPDYQRGFSWENKQLEEFWNDISLLDMSNKHYLGVLTTQDVPEEDYKQWENDLWLIEKKRYTATYIVDGQQRITTCLLLLSAIVNIIESEHEKKELQFTPLEDIKKRYFFEKKGEYNLYSMIFGYIESDPLYNYLGHKIYEIPNFTIDPDIITTKYTSNLYNAYDFFKNKIKNKSFEEIEEIYTKLTTLFVFNIYKISEELDVFVTFETMNNRGKELSILELLKNRLIYLTTLCDDEPDGSAKDIRKTINASWKIVYDYLGKNEANLLSDDHFLNAFLNTYIFKNDEINVLKHEAKTLSFRIYPASSHDHSYIMDKIFTVKNLKDKKVRLYDIHDFIIELSKNVKMWYEIKNPIKSSFSDKLLSELLKCRVLSRADNSLRFYRPDFDEKIFEYFYFHTNEAERIEYLRVKNQIILLQNIFDRSDEQGYKISSVLDKYTWDNAGTNYSKFNSDLKPLLRDPNNLDYIIEKIRDSVKNNYNKKVRINFYENNSFPTTYVLATYELTMCLQNRDYISKDYLNDLFYDNSKYTLEHIYPLSGKEDSMYWKEIFGEYDANSRHNLKNNLGNLIRISNKKNNKIGNKPYEYKLEKFKTGTLSEINLVEKYKEWNVDSITDRGVTLITHFLDMLQIPKVTKSKKLYILGLDDLKKK